MLASNAARSEKIVVNTQKTGECTKIAKFVENNHFRLKTSENYKDRYSLLTVHFWVPEPPTKQSLPPWTPPQGPLPLDPAKCCDVKSNCRDLYFCGFTPCEPMEL